MIVVFKYHSEANPAEIFIPPWTKDLKTVRESKQGEINVLNELFARYCLTPHPA